MASSDLTDRVVPDLEARIEEAVQAFRETHTHPGNIALHAVAYLLLAKGSMRLLRGKVFSAAAHIGAGTGLLVVGHRIEGNEPFTALKRLTGS